MRLARLLLLALACDESGVLDAPDAPPTDDTDPAAPDSDASPGTEPPSETDDTPASPSPTPAAPCGRDPDAVTGVVEPDLPTVPSPGVFSGDPGDDGPFRFEAREAQVRNPNRGRDAIRVTSRVPIGDGPFPLVVVLPGFGVPRATYDHFTGPLATHGFVVVSLDLPNTGFLDPARHDLNAVEARAVVDWAIGAASFADRVDARRVALVGHSQGGKIAFYAAATDPRVDLVVGWDPQNGGGPPCAFDDLAGGDCNAFPVAPNCEADEPGLLHRLRAESLVFAADDRRLTPDAHLRAIHFYRGAPSPAHLVWMPSVSHAAWATDGETSEVSRRVHTALLLARLQGFSGLERWLPAGAFLDEAPGVDEHRTK